ncbi:hypothetical protein JSE7799_01774 [Jannaschia seosinensis]|uniref:Uncharacterized protein n=1 Tax=Jannaschia seosinensis TaxID=313367 RepID=A0A0M7BCJ7_9RHOB|nr:hypothetical protein [Jannaschia seosinensis]CUH39055.1 hypothetical protein JSE7799_01774 [Jannaschia seosinensis]
MARFSHRRRLPRGINFLLGGVIVAATLVGAAVISGVVDLGLGGAPDVLIEGSR